VKNLAILALTIALAIGMARADEGIEVEATVPAGEITVSTFYETLTPYGKWIQDDTYGWIFQPAVVVGDADWRPYVNGGHWVHTDCGWYWESDYAWGWAAFHYGRWHRHAAHGWVWVPDCTWGPAWVEWRECETHYGWAPLPPGSVYVNGGFTWRGHGVAVGFDFGLVEADFSFVPCQSFFAVNLVGVCVGRHHVHGFWGTTVIRNTYVIRNKYVCNEGFNRVIVEKHCGKFGSKHVQSLGLGEGQRIRERHGNNTIHAYRPDVSNKTPYDPNAAQKRHQERLQQQQQRREQQQQIRQHNQQQREQGRQEQQKRHEEFQQHQQQRRQENWERRQQNQQHSAPPRQQHQAPQQHVQPQHHPAPQQQHHAVPQQHKHHGR
jgi:hypothetical protein